ncbi:PDR/VanB family oxidoreductase [Rossellomorea vietnamensis]|uniref:PDR/VanB family oxidoreductase n=1 Tax=Rossellomorea vietnamensis TaxID=218284 RepID=UPI0030890BF7|nr:PDR/VanB family oxidoreductase [Rossellomorea vietnamensis]
MNLNKTIAVRVQSVHQETPYVKRFSLTPAYNELLPPFSGGSHITTYIETGGVTIARSYSLTNPPGQRDTYQIAIRLNEQSTGGSRYWHEQVKVGDTLRISPPQNHFPLSFRGKHHVFYAAGIGITPFLSMMAELKKENRSFELYYAAKSEESCPFFTYLKKVYPHESHFYFSSERRLNDQSLWEHRIGTHVYFCGPTSFIDEFTASALTIGYPRSSIHFERFAPRQTLKRQDFLVEVENGPTLKVRKDRTLLEALLKAGVNAPYSCRVGRCGTCEVKVLEGEVDHGDSFLSESERSEHHSILTCVSRARAEKLRIALS